MLTPLRWLLTGLSLIFLAALALPSLWLLVDASTLRGRIIAMTGLITAVWPWLLIVSAGSGAAARRIQIGGALAILTGLSLIVSGSPDGTPGSDSPVVNRYTGRARFNRLAITNLVPEIEQLNAGFTIAPYVDALLDVRESRRVRSLTREIYGEMEADPDFRALGSALGLGHRNLFGGSADLGHYYLYVPRSRPDGPLPALVFLHGSAGNFKAYTWILAHLAEERRMVVIAPTFGFGNWRQAGGVETILRALDDANSLVEIDPDRVYLMGLSNGGLGVSLAGAAHPDRFRGLIFLSPVFAAEVTRQPAFLSAWSGRPVLVITGEADDRIPLNYVEAQVRDFKAANIDATFISYPDEDHFLVFSRRDEVLADFNAWLEAH